MSLIKCIECGNNISDRAISCPHCGCPAEAQAGDTTKYQIICNPEAFEESTPKIKNYDKWAYASNLILQKRGPEAKRVIEDIVGPSKYVMMVISRMIRTEGIPYDTILEFFPDQAAHPIVKKPEPTMAPCTACSRPISVKAETCPHCGQPTGVHVCPRCGSTDWVYIDAVSKVGAMALFGAFAVNTVRSKYQCKACKFKY